MKKIFYMLTAFLLISGTVYSQKITADKVPAEVKTAFRNKFPDITKVTYEMEKADYEISFEKNGIQCSANFDKTGKWLETETELKETEIPDKVKATLDKELAGYKLKESVTVETPEIPLKYEFDLVKGEAKLVLEIDPDGKLLKKTAAPADDDDD